MIFSQSSDLNTRAILWTPRPTDNAPQSSYSGQIPAIEGSWFAACYADKYADEATAKLPAFEEAE
jgi:hypothetical protein